MSSINQLTAAQLRQAANLKDKISTLQRQLSQLIEASVSPGSSVESSAARPVRKKISAAGIAKIRAAQKARWAKVKALKSKLAPAKKPMAKKKALSAAAKAKMSAAAKARWAKVKAAKN